MAEEEKISRGRRKELLARLKAEVRPKRKLLYLAAFLSWLQFLMRIISFALIAQALAALYQGQALDLVGLILVLLFLNAFGFVAALSGKRLQGRVSQFARDGLKQRFFQAFVRRDGDFGEGRTAADILTVASQGIDSLDTYYSYYLPLSLRTYANCLTVLLLVFYLFPWGGLIFILALPLIPVSIILMQKRSRRIMNRYWASYMDVGNLFLDDLQGLNTLYSYQADEKYEQEFAAQAEDFRDATMELLGFQLQSVGYMDAVMYLGIGISGFTAAAMLGAGQLSLFAMIYFVLIATEFFTPIRETGYGMHLVMMSAKMADRIFGFLDSIEPEAEAGEQRLSAFDQLTVRDLSFSYEGSPVFKGLTFEARVGQLVAVAGESGRGKTTLAKLLLGKLPLKPGHIFFGQQDAAALSQAAIYQQVMYVSADSQLFSATILENLQLAVDWTQEALEAWLRDKGVLDFVWDLPEGLATQIGENGSLLSPGQRQQLICVRAILAQRSLYIFDEITSSVDKDHEALIYDLLALLAQEALVIEITHKMKQVQKADQLIFMGAGGLALGSPAELYRDREDYRQLVDRQKELEDLISGNEDNL